MHEAPGSIIIMKKKARRIFQFWPQTDENQGVASQVTYKFSLLFIFIFFFCCCDKYPEKKQTRTSNSVSSVALFPTSLLLLNVPKPSQIALPAGGQLFKHKESKEDITYSNHNKLILKLDFNT